MYYNSCPICGANLNPGESCDCEEQKQESNTNVQVIGDSSSDVPAYEEVMGMYE